MLRLSIGLTQHTLTYKKKAIYYVACPVSVLTMIVSPTFACSGTWTSIPLSSVADLRHAVALSPRSHGSVSAIVYHILSGSDMLIIFSLCFIKNTFRFSLRYMMISLIRSSSISYISHVSFSINAYISHA